MPDAISYICVHAQLPVGATYGAKKLVAPEMHQIIMHIHQQARPSHQW